MGLDVAGAFDSASLIRLVATSLLYGVPELKARLIGKWLTRRSYKVKLSTPGGAVMGKPKRPDAWGDPGFVKIAREQGRRGHGVQTTEDGFHTERRVESHNPDLC